MEKKQKFQVRFDNDLWEFLRHYSFDQKISMNKLIEECLKKFKKNVEKGLTDSGTMIL